MMKVWNIFCTRNAQTDWKRIVERDEILQKSCLALKKLSFDMFSTKMKGTSWWYAQYKRESLVWFFPCRQAADTWLP